MAKHAIEESPTSNGVDELIARLREEGVSAGRVEAERILSEARAEAALILDKANAEARDHLQASRKEADAYRAAGEEALKTAMRDTMLDLKASLMKQFSQDVKRLVSHQMKDPEVLKRMIIEVAGRMRDGAGMGDDDGLELILPESAIGLEELRSDPAELEKGELTKFVFGLTGEMLRDGVSFSRSDDVSAGIRVQVKDKDVTFDLTEEAVAALLLEHLQPRFRAILEGIVK